MNEKFTIPCAGAIIERVIDGEIHILVQNRNKENDHNINGQLEIPAGKIREYEDIFSTLRREVLEETGLTITSIHGETEAVTRVTYGRETKSFFPFCITQNMSGAYSILLSTFLCEAEGEPFEASDESDQIRWMPVHELRTILTEQPEKIFLMHINALSKYLGV